MKRIFWIVAIFFVFVLTLFFALYQFAGLKEYLQAVSLIRSLPAEQRAKAELKFYDGGGTYGYTGMLAYVGKHGLWVWGAKGPKYFRTDRDTAYIKWSVCSEEILAKIEAQQPFAPVQSVTGEVNEWVESVQVGGFIDIKLATKLNGGTEGNAREARAYDWWVFTAVDMRAQCKK